MRGPAPLACLQAALARHGPFVRLGVAVSGGGDSVAALVLAVEALGTRAVAAVTVDHGLRPEAADEAAQVATLCARLGVEHKVLHWDGAWGGNLQQAARRARLALIGGWALGRVDAVIVAHTLDDQAETVLMRLARGSGVDGLSGMDEARRAAGVVWLRPFLLVRRAALREELRARGVGWVEDPSNADPRFLRVRARKALATLAPLGIDAPGLVQTAARLRRARGALERDTAQALRDHLREAAGTAVLDKRVLDLPPEIRDRVMAHLLQALSGAEHRPRLAALHRLLAAGQGTLMGCVLVDEGAHLRLYRELCAVQGLTAPVGAWWDGRWRAAGPRVDGALIGALGERGLLQLGAQARAGWHPHWRETGLSRGVLAAMPAIWHDERVIAAPLALWLQGWALFARPLAASGGGMELSH